MRMGSSDRRYVCGTSPRAGSSAGGIDNYDV